MAKHSKRFEHLLKQVDTKAPQDLASAVKLLQSLESTLPANIKKIKFDQTVTIAIRLGVDPKQADQKVRGSVVLPHGIGKTKTVLVFCQGDNIAVAQAAGADFAGGKELADKVKDGWTDFDVAIATPDMMGVVGPLGRVLGPRGLMPSPRAGTVTQDITTAIKEYKAGKVEFRCDDGANVHCVIGKISFPETQIIENAEAFVKLLRSLKPSTSKGQYIRNVSLTATMSPGIGVTL